MSIRVKRAYDEPSPADGFRVLVDRIWPRGLSKARAKLDFWAKEAAPSAQLRTWFAHDPAKWDEFRKRYFHELEKNPEVLSAIAESAKTKEVTLLFAARDQDHNNAVALAEYLKRKA